MCPVLPFAGYVGPVVTFVHRARSFHAEIDSALKRLTHLRAGRAEIPQRQSKPVDRSCLLLHPQLGSRVDRPDSGTHPCTANGILGVDRLSTDSIRDSLRISPVPEPSIGILSIDYVDKDRDNLRVLFLQAEGQLSGYLPDSTATSLNKENVRDGHYPCGATFHFYTANINGAPLPRRGAFVTRFSVPKLESRAGGCHDRRIAGSTMRNEGGP